MRKVPQLILLTAITSVLPAAAQAATSSSPAAQAGIDRLKNDYRGAKISDSPATGTARFVRLGPSSALRLGVPAAAQSSSRSSALDATATSCVDRHAAAFGLRSAAAGLT